MPIIKSAKKRVRQSEKRRVRNLGTKNMMKNAIKDFEKTIKEDAKGASAKFSQVQKLIDTAAKKRVISSNKAARKVSQLNSMMNAALGAKK